MQSGRCENCFNPALPGKRHCLEHHKNQSNYSYGLDHDLAKKMAGKYDPAKAQAVKVWVEAVTRRQLGNDLQAGLKSGVALCELINAIFPGTVGRINQGAMPFVQRENIVAYLDGCKKQGLRETDTFVTQDLFEGSNMVQVIDQICALGQLAVQKGYRGPQLVISGGAVQVASNSSSSVVKAPAPPQVSLYGSSSSAAPVSSPPAAAPAPPARNFGSSPAAASSPKSFGSYSSTPSYSAPKPAAPAAAPAAAAPAAGPKFCGQCGKPRADMAAKFCGECGSKY